MKTIMKRHLVSMCTIFIFLNALSDSWTDTMPTWTDPKTQIKWTYQNVNQGVAVYAASPLSRVLQIPAYIAGCPVLEINTIDPNACAAYNDIVENVEIPEGVRTIGSGVFSRFRVLKTVNIPATVEVIGESVFETTPSLASITVDAENANFTSNGGMLMNKTGTILLGCPGGMKGVLTIPEGVTSIATRACYHLSSITTVVLSKKVTSLGRQAFSRCEGLTSFVVDARNPSFCVDAGSLYDKTMTSLICCPGGATALRVPTGVTTIADSACYQCRALKSVIFPKSLATIVGWAFYRCYALESVVFTGGPPKWKDAERFAGMETLWASPSGAIGRYPSDEEQWNAVISDSKWEGLTMVPFEPNEGYKVNAYGPYAPGEKVSVTVNELIGYTAKGLPKGLKLDKKTGEISGTPTKPTGDAGVTVTFTKKGSETLTATFIVSDWPQVSVSCDGLANGKFTVGVACDGEAIPVEIEPPSAVKSVKASKLPSGMKLVKDKSTGEWSITGSPTKAGTYNVVLTVTTTYGSKQTLTFPVTVEALPSWAVGTFIGMVRQVDRNPQGETFFDGEELHDWYDVLTTVNIAKTGKVTVSWKIPDAEYKLPSLAIAAASNDCYMIDGTGVVRGKTEQIELSCNFVVSPLSQLDDDKWIGGMEVDLRELRRSDKGKTWEDVWTDGMQYTFTTDDGYPLLQNVWERKDIGQLPDLKGVKETVLYREHTIDLSFGSKGKIAIKVQTPEGKSYSTSAILALRECHDGVWYGEIAASVTYKKGVSGAAKVFDVVIDGSEVSISPREDLNSEEPNEQY